MQSWAAGSSLAVSPSRCSALKGLLNWHGVHNDEGQEQGKHNKEVSSARGCCFVPQLALIFLVSLETQHGNALSCQMSEESIGRWAVAKSSNTCFKSPFLFEPCGKENCSFSQDSEYLLERAQSLCSRRRTLWFYSGTAQGGLLCDPCDTICLLQVSTKLRCLQKASTCVKDASSTKD